MAHFIREIVETNPRLHDAIVERLMDTFPSVRASRVATCALWIVAEYCTTRQEVEAALEVSARTGGAPPRAAVPTLGSDWNGWVAGCVAPLCRCRCPRAIAAQSPAPRRAAPRR